MTTTAALAVTWLFVALNLVLTLRLAGRVRAAVPGTPQDLPPILAPPLGEPAPPFAVTTVDGRQLALTDYADRSLTLLYVSDHCPTCRVNFPRLGQLQAVAEAAGEDLVVLFLEDSPETGVVVDRLRREFDFPADTCVIPAGHPLRREYNPREATPLFHHVVDGVLERTGVLGSPAWRELTDSWRAGAAAVSTGAERP